VVSRFIEENMILFINYLIFISDFFKFCCCCCLNFKVHLIIMNNSFVSVYNLKKKNKLNLSKSKINDTQIFKYDFV
jgi:hypothetical protein